MIDYKGGYEASGELQNGLASLRWGADWILKVKVELENVAFSLLKWCVEWVQATKLDQNAVYGQVGNGGADHAYWGRPEEWPVGQIRPSYKITSQMPGTDLAANYASALAATSLAIGASDANYAANLLSVARQLYDFAKNNRGIYSNSISDAAGFYA